MNIFDIIQREVDLIAKEMNTSKYDEDESDDIVFIVSYYKGDYPTIIITCINGNIKASAPLFPKDTFYDIESLKDEMKWLFNLTI